MLEIYTEVTESVEGTRSIMEKEKILIEPCDMQESCTCRLAVACHEEKTFEKGARKMLTCGSELGDGLKMV